MNSLISNFSILHRQTDVYLNHKLEEYGISSKQLMYILYLCENEGLSQENLASELQIDKGAVAKSIKQLENKGFLIRKVAPDDKRQYMLFPTSESKSLYPSLLEITSECEQNSLKNLTPIEASLLTNLLDKII